MSKNERQIAVADFETDPFKRGRPAAEIRPVCCGYFDGSLLLTWWGPDCAKKFVVHCRKLKRKTVIYFHNGGNFDNWMFLEFLPVEDCKFMCIGKRIVQIVTPWGVEFRDSFAIIPKGLAAYQKTKFDYRKLEADVRERWRPEILSYLKDDLRDLRKMVVNFFDRFPFALTLASSVFKVLQSDYSADTGTSTEGYDTAFRPYYFAGRVQFWKLGKVPFKVSVVDINSAFPWAMTLPHAHGTEFTVGKSIPRRWAEQSFYVVNGWSGGEFPKRNASGGVDFPDRSDTYHVTGWELLEAIRQNKFVGEILQVLTPKSIMSYAPFIHHYYDAKVAAKRAGDKDEEFFNKIVLNAGGYGRMAINRRRFQEVAVTSIYDTPPEIEGRTKREKERLALDAGWRVLWDDPERGLTFHARKSYRPGIDKFINVATAASITGCVRALLIRAKAVCKDTVYCDTDSLVAREVAGLQFGETLGHWKLEMTGGTAWIAGKKLYAICGRVPGQRGLQWKTASKGVRLSYKAICAVAEGKTRRYTAIAPTYSVFSPPRFVSRSIRRADKRLSA